MGRFCHKLRINSFDMSRTEVFEWVQSMCVGGAAKRERSQFNFAWLNKIYGQVFGTLCFCVFLCSPIITFRIDFHIFVHISDRPEMMKKKENIMRSVFCGTCEFLGDHKLFHRAGVHVLVTSTYICLQFTLIKIVPCLCSPSSISFEPFIKVLFLLSSLFSALLSICKHLRCFCLKIS